MRVKSTPEGAAVSEAEIVPAEGLGHALHEIVAGTVWSCRKDVSWDVRSSRRRPILLAEDDASTRDGLSEFLREMGYEIVAAEDGQTAMDLLVAGLMPSLLIVDLGMPHLGGGELLKYVASDPVLRLIPVLIVTGNPDRIGRAVADAVLPKPIDLIALVEHVRRLTASQSQRQHRAE